MPPFKQTDTVRSMVPIQIDGWATACPPGYHFTVVSVNDDGTLAVSRSSPQGRAIVRVTDLEPAYRVVNGISYGSRTPDAVVVALEAVRRSGERVRIRLGDSVTGRDWLDEHDVEGRVVNSMGPTRVPLLIHSRRSLGGPALLDEAIVRVVTTGRRGRVLYVHPAYHTGMMAIVEPRDIGYAAAVTVDGKLHAQFRAHAAAEQWVRRMAR
jgi:hypothetical protein